MNGASISFKATEFTAHINSKDIDLYIAKLNRLNITYPYNALGVLLTCINISGGPLSALTCCVNARLLSGDKKNIAVNLFSKLGWELGLYYASYDDFHPDILARMYT